MTNAQSLTLRPVEASDRPFLVDLYAETRAAELGLTGWSAEQQHAFVLMQFAAQDADYRRRFPAASFDVVLRDDEPVGRLYVDRRPSSIHVLDIIVAPPFRRLGIAAALFRELMREAAAGNRGVTLYVEPGTPAHAWYQRLGFTAPSEAQGVHLFMEWRPS